MGGGNPERVGPASSQNSTSLCRLASLLTRRRTASGVLSISPRKRTSPWRPSAAKAIEIFSLEVSRPTNTLLLCGMARPLCGRLGAGPSGTTLARRIRGTSHLRRERTYGLSGAEMPDDQRSGTADLAQNLVAHRPLYHAALLHRVYRPREHRLRVV